MKIPLMSPNITDDDIDAAVEVMRSGALIQGKNVAAFESAVGEYLGVEHVVAVSSGTAALHLALLALGIGSGDEVIVPAFSFPATANVVEIVGARPVFVDIDIASFNIDASLIECVKESQTRAIMPVHEFGLASDITEIARLAQSHNLLVIEDAACAFGAAENGKHVGTFGAIGAFSLHPRKAITSGEGGFLTTLDEKLGSKLRSLRNHGIELIDGRQEFTGFGLNYRLTDFQAALVLSQFARLDKNLTTKRRLADVYLDELQDVNRILLPALPQNKDHTWQTFHIILDESIDRDRVITELKSKGVGTNFGAHCIPATNFYQEKYGLDCEREFPNALRAYRHGLALPIYEKLTAVEIRYICDTLRQVFGNLR